MCSHKMTPAENVTEKLQLNLPTCTDSTPHDLLVIKKTHRLPVSVNAVHIHRVGEAADLHEGYRQTGTLFR